MPKSTTSKDTSNNSPTVSFRINPSLLAQLKSYAKSHPRLNKSIIINDALAAYLNADNQTDETVDQENTVAALIEEKLSSFKAQVQAELAEVKDELTKLLIYASQK